jgi:hypothetical protein
MQLTVVCTRLPLSMHSSTRRPRSHRVSQLGAELARGRAPTAEHHIGQKVKVGSQAQIARHLEPARKVAGGGQLGSGELGRAARERAERRRVDCNRGVGLWRPPSPHAALMFAIDDKLGQHVVAGTGQRELDYAANEWPGVPFEHEVCARGETRS